ncbi:MAG: phosphatase PAP2 family protein [Deltaproteobacteria bacterium]|nr:phosphatase PAP2 family protein [Deltaproteobacteria bacterium]
MIDALLRADHALFWRINGWQGNPAIDALFLWGTELGTAWFGAIPVAVLFYVRNRARVREALLAIALGSSLGLVNLLLKWLVARPRPTRTFENVQLLGPWLGWQSFPSGHTLTAFIILAFLLRMDRKLGYAWLPCALLVALSRIYIGVHFPSDVVAGALLGFLPCWFLQPLLEKPRENARESA